MKYFQAFIDRWLSQRIPAANEHSLDHTNIFIFPSRFGVLFLLLCALLFLLGTNYQNNLMLLLCYFLLALFLVNLLASYINFARIQVQQGKSNQVFVGDNLPLPLWLDTNTQQKVAINGILYFSFAQGKVAQRPVTKIDANHFSNPITVSFKCEQRGELKLPRITIASYYPLGLFKCWTHLAFNNEIIIYPKPIPCQLSLLTLEQDERENGKNANTLSAGHDDFSHLKAYQAGEPLHHVAWKQLAKGRGMVSKHFASHKQKIGWLKLSSSSITTPQQLEQEISQLTYQVIELARQQTPFGLDLGSNCIAPNTGQQHREACLKALALYPLGEQ